MRLHAAPLCACALTLLGCSSLDVLGERQMQTGEGALPSGTGGGLSNVLEERQALPISAVNAKLNAAFLQLFFGDPRTEAVFFDQGDGTGYIQDINNRDVRTDSMGYGMLVTVSLDQRAIFDQLWAWTKTHMMFPDGPSKGLLRWRCDTDGAVCEDSAATDSSSVIVTSLFIASRRWPTPGQHDYASDALGVLAAMTGVEQHASAAAEGVVNCFDVVAALPRADSRSPEEQVPLDYLMPAFYEVWAARDPDRATLWRQMAENARDILAQAADPITGLLPEWVTYTGTPVTGQGDYESTTSRTFFNEALDHIWSGPNAAIVAQNERVLDFFLSEGIDSYAAEYRIGGQPLVSYNTVGHRALVALAAGTTENPKYDVFLEDLLAQEVPTGTYRYYEGMLYILSLLTLSGQMAPP